MTDQTHVAASDSPEHRARTVSILGLVLQILLCVFLLVVSLWCNSLAVHAEVRLALAGIGAWFILVLISHQRKLVRAEMLEAADLKARRQSAGTGGEAIFEVDEEQLMLARRRLHLMLKWFVPVLALLLAGYYFASAFLFWPIPFTEGFSSDNWPPTMKESVSAAFLIGAGFIAFLFSRYVQGMAAREEWRELRAGASMLFGNALICAVLALMLGLTHFNMPVPERVTALVIRILLVVLGTELILNLILDVYRPRAAGEIQRLTFDSRFLGLFSESGGIARSIAEAINYQFGFEVSSTWFYQLMYRATIPLLGFGVLCMVGVSSVAIVEPHERAVTERFGKLMQPDEPLGPGFHLKFPWPIDKIYKFPVDRLRTIVLGARESATEEDERAGVATVLWTTENHGATTDNYVLVATPNYDDGRPARAAAEKGEFGDGDAEQSVPVSILRAMAQVQYRIRNLYAFGYGYQEADILVRGIADRELIRYAASAEVDGIMGPHRQEAAAVLKERIQRRADEAGLGVDIVFVGLQDFHPHMSVAGAFQAVVGAEQERDAAEQKAQGDAIMVLAEVAGEADLALDLAEAIRAENQLRRTVPPDSEALKKATQRRDRLFVRASGQVSGIMARARAYRWERENEWLSRAERFEKELLAYQAASTVYPYRKYLAALHEGLKRVRKFVIGANTDHRELIIILDQKEEETFKGLAGR